MQDTYIYPPRATTAIPITEIEFLANLGWLAQLKYNDTHCLIKFTPTTTELWTRHGTRNRDYNPTQELKDQLEALRTTLNIDKNQWSLIDGGILDRKHRAIKDTIVIWDMLVYNNEHLINTTYNYRYNLIKQSATTNWYYKDYCLGYKLSTDIIVPANHYGHSDWLHLWENVITPINAPFTTGTPGQKDYSCHPLIEGLMFKNGNGVLKYGYKEKNNDTWLTRCRVVTGRHRF